MEVQMSKMSSCKFCGEAFDDRKVGGHTKYCKLNPSRETQLQKLSQARSSITPESKKKMRESLKEAWKRGAYSESMLSRIGKPGRSHSELARERMSASRKAWLTNNPEKHPWKRSSKFNSEPCQKLKDALQARSIDFHEEFAPLEDRFFSLDIAFPALKVGIEVNGEQHYNRSGSLKPYYQQRHELIESAGWKLYEVHYSICYDQKRLCSIVDSIVETHDLSGVDLTFEVRSKVASTKKFPTRRAYAETQRLPPETLLLWREAIDSVDTMKLGFIGKIAKKMDCSHTHVRRVLNTYFSEIATYKRKSL
jgi:hypothetical protein